MTPTIRPEEPSDRGAVYRVNRLAFGGEDEAALVDNLRAGGFAKVSLVAELDGEIVGHVLFSTLPILAERRIVQSVALAPVAVAPEHQRKGIGSALVRAGLAACRDRGERIAVVLGHADYYPRFGFSAQLAEPLSSPFSGKDSWMAAELVPGALYGVRGWVQYPPPFGIGPFVRPAHETDRGEWLRMRAALWPDESPGEHAAEVDGHFAGRAPGHPGLFLASAAFVAVRASGALCGFVEASVRSYAEDCATDRVGYVEGWFVDPDARRQGVGKQLVAAAEAWAARRGCTEMASDAHIENTVSRDAHRALGFTESSRIANFRKSLPGSAGATAVANGLRLLGVDGAFAVCKLPAGAPLPAWALAGVLFSVTRTADELSIVCAETEPPSDVTCERGWRCLRVAGAMPFTLVGVLAALTAPLAAARVGVFAVSTFDTDYLFVKAADLASAVAALRAAGHAVEA